MTAPARGRTVPRTEDVPACPVCTGKEADELWILRDRLHGVPGRYRYVRCARCASVYQSPRVRDEDLHLCYPDAYYTHSAAGGESSASAGRSARDRIRQWIRWAVQGGEAPGAPGRLLGRALAASRWLRERAFFGLRDEVIPRSPRPGRALEVGPGSGWELHLLERLGWNAEGVELDPTAAEQARRRAGVRVRIGDFADVVRPHERFDLIYLSHVFEHLPDIRRTLALFRRRLRPRGRVVLAYPNPQGAGARIWGSDWFAWEPPRHLVLPSLRGMRLLARDLGLEVRLRTGARNAAFIQGASRRLRCEAGVDSDIFRSGALDAVFARVEGVLAATGLPVGDEVTAILEPEGGRVP